MIIKNALQKYPILPFIQPPKTLLSYLEIVLFCILIVLQFDVMQTGP